MPQANGLSMLWFFSFTLGHMTEYNIHIFKSSCSVDLFKIVKLPLSYTVMYVSSSKLENPH